MKRSVLFLIFCWSFFGYAQKVTLNTKKNVENLRTLEIKDDYFSVLESKNKETNQYEYQFYGLNGTVTSFLAAYKSDVKLDLELFHKYQNNLVLLFSTKGKGKKQNRPRAKSSKKTKKYRLVSVGIDTKTVQIESLDIENPDNKFSYDNYSCLMYCENQEIKLMTFNDCGLHHTTSIKLEELSDVKLSKINTLPKDYEQKIGKPSNQKIGFLGINLTSSLSAVSSSKIYKNIGVAANRIFYDEDNVYLNYIMPKENKSLIIRFDKKGTQFEWFGVIEVPFGFDKKSNDYNGFLTRDVYYFVAERKGKILFTIKNLKTGDLKVHHLNALAADNSIDKEAFGLIKKGFNYINHVPSLTVYQQKDSENEIVRISYISNKTYYHDPFFYHQMFHQQMFMQQQRMMDMQMQQIRANIPGGFTVQFFPEVSNFITKEDRTLKLIINKTGEVKKYSDEKTKLTELSLEEEEKITKHVVKTLKEAIDGKLENYTYHKHKASGKLYVAFYDKKQQQLIFNFIENPKNEE